MVRRIPKAALVKGAFSRIFPLLVVLVGIGSGGNRYAGVSAQSSSETDDGFCQDKLADCTDATVCTSCVFDFNEVPCTDYAFDAADSCSLLGTSFCCAADGSGLTCKSDGYTLEYWECALQRSGCSLLDMPCMVDGSSDRDIESSVGDPEVISSESDAGVSNLTSGAATKGGVSGTFGGVAAALLTLAMTAASTGFSFSS